MVWSWVGQLGGWGGMVGLTALLFWMLATGRLYTRSQHDSIVSLYKENAAKDDTIKAQQSEQISALLEGSATAADFFAKVPVKNESGDTIPQPSPRRKATPKQGAAP